MEQSTRQELFKFERELKKLLVHYKNATQQQDPQKTT